MLIDGARARGRSALSGIGLLVVCAVVALGATACGGTKKKPVLTGSGTGIFLKGTPAQRAALIEKRLAAAGYVVHPVPQVFGEYGLDAAPGPVIAPQVSFTAVDNSLNGEWTRLHREIATITAQTRPAALANKGLSHTTYERLLGIAAQVTVLSLKERTILLFDSAMEASLYTQRLDQQNIHRRDVLTEGSVQSGNVQISMYRADGPTIFVGKADTSSDAAGTIKEVFDKQAFGQFVAVAEGRA